VAVLFALAAPTFAASTNPDHNDFLSSESSERLQVGIKRIIKAWALDEQPMLWAAFGGANPLHHSRIDQGKGKNE